MASSLKGLLGRMLNRLPTEEILNPDGSPYLTRYVIRRGTDRKAVYIHHFKGTDKEPALHDHPKWFLSVGLKGRYVEETERGVRLWAAPWFRWFPAYHRHRIIVPMGEDCWTLTVTGAGVEDNWGFYPDGVYVPWREYEARTGRGEA